MIRLTSLRDAWHWATAKPYRTWIAHCLIALLLAPVVGAWTMMIFFVLREVEQVLLTWLDEAPQDWQDHILDLSAPFVALGLYTLL